MTFNEKNYKYPQQADNYKKLGPPVADHAYLFDSIEGTKVKMLNPHGKNHVELDISDLSGVIEALIALPKP
ncbi:MAG: hypothetical protein LBT09_07405 [Planctomycetaceae bacterium]|jgi:hypothetical protein|nr:hypothetical protein [Planctomycetaceae bacterium]